jgi:hypothetical protein
MYLIVLDLIHIVYMYLQLFFFVSDSVFTNDVYMYSFLSLRGAARGWMSDTYSFSLLKIVSF